MMRKHLSKLASKCQGIAGVISDGEKVQYECPEDLKSTLLEVSHTLDNECVKVFDGYPQREGWYVENARGAMRKITFRERLAVWLLKGKAEIRY
jgi:hypothetical protein